VKFAHFTITDVSDRHFYAHEKISRGALGDAGYNRGGTLVWIEDWQVDYNGNFRLRAAAGQCAIDLELEPQMAPVLQGADGFSRKASGPGRASYYYSIPILKTRGTVRLGVNTWTVAGTSWFDREWATNQLEPQQAGWNWFAIQLNDGSSLMLYQMRLKDGGIDPYSSGKYVSHEGQVTPLARNDFELVPNRFWQRDRSAPRYPIGWQVSIPKLSLVLAVVTPVEDQELRLSARYWEGCIRLAGTRAGQPVQGAGYMELTGYGGSVSGLTSP
jgi:predicted secreted hydrolase